MTRPPRIIVKFQNTTEKETIWFQNFQKEEESIQKIKNKE